MNIPSLLSSLTKEEKVALVSGTDFMFTNPIPGKRIPSLCMADGPHGLRKQTGSQDNGISESEPSTAFPTAATTASSWEPDNTCKIGKAIAEECRHYGVNVLLGPGANIKRNPLCGRNFEYFSEDPLLAGKMAAAEVSGVQSQGVGVSVKHFALNNSENYRFMGNSEVDMRAIREIYLKVFEIIVKESHPTTMMCAYNKINGTYCSENKWLLTKILRYEWGFDGAVMTDWGAICNRVKAIKAGLELEMPGDTAICRRMILDALADGTLQETELNICVERILRLIEKLAGTPRLDIVDWDAHHALAGEIAADSAVLLKNDGVLPLDKKNKYLVVGDLFEKMRYQGAGSSMINATKVTSPKDAFDAKGIVYHYVRGYAENQTDPNEDFIREAVDDAEGHDTVLVFAGLTDYVESEGADRENMHLPQNQLALIDALTDTNNKVIIVLFGGSVMELPFAEKVNAILNMLLPGQNGGSAASALLFGDKTPCGKLAESWPFTYDDVPFGAEFAQTRQELYKESIFVGYRYYKTLGKKVRYPFGYGLSYTNFDYSNLSIFRENGRITVKCDIKNIGAFKGAEIAELYVRGPESDIFKPLKELRGFAKVYLQSGEKQSVVIVLSEQDLRYFNPVENRWVLEHGTYTFEICSDCETVQLSDTVDIVGEQIPSPYSGTLLWAYGQVDISKVNDVVFEELLERKIPEIPSTWPFTLESRFTDLQQSFIGRVLFNAVLSVARKQIKEAENMSEGQEKDNKIKGAQFLERVLESNSLRTMSMAGGKAFPYNFACGFRDFANGHLLQGIKNFMRPVKVPKLPKEEHINE